MKLNQLEGKVLTDEAGARFEKTLGGNRLHLNGLFFPRFEVLYTCKTILGKIQILQPFAKLANNNLFPYLPVRYFTSTSPSSGICVE